MRISEVERANVVRIGLDIDENMILGKNVHQLFNEILDTARWITKQKSVSQITGNTDGLAENIQTLNELKISFDDLIDKKHRYLIFTEYVNDPTKQQLLQSIVTKMTATLNREINKSKKALK
jgi:hypothetical protein